MSSTLGGQNSKANCWLAISWQIISISEISNINVKNSADSIALVEKGMYTSGAIHNA
jgi:hypothetical protein